MQIYAKNQLMIDITPFLRLCFKIIKRIELDDKQNYYKIKYLGIENIPSILNYIFRH